jgi:NAD-dependent deacetylase
MKNLVVLTGAGVSAESGIKTFRDSDGLWENYPVQDVASIEGWYRDRKLVLQFYNERRRQAEKALPNKAHKIIAELEKNFNVTVVTQNIDNLHERGGSTHVIHLHGEITKVRGENEGSEPFDIGYKDINIGDKTPQGYQLRPHIVWFGEAVPMLNKAAEAVGKADILLVVGTSLVVYPAAGLINYIKYGNPLYLIDPKPIKINYENYHQIQDLASSGMEKFRDIVLKK